MLDVRLRSACVLGLWAGLLGTGVAWADPLNGTMELTTSVSNAYDARSVLTNPAAMGYQTELNGPQLLSSFSFGFNESGRNSFSTALTYGYLGVGIEKLQALSDSMMRYSLGLGFPVTPDLYFGGRYVFNRSDTAALQFDSVDLGVQYRAFSFLSLGVLGNRLNTPSMPGGKSPAQVVGGITLRPWRTLELSADADTFSNNFGKHWGYQAGVAFEPIQGLKLRAGYHDQFKWQFGLQWNLDRFSFYATAQPGSSTTRYVTGFQQAPQPYPSRLAAANALKVEIDGTLGEEAVHGGLFSKDRPSLLELLTTLTQAEKDDHLRLVVVRLEHFPLGLAAAEDVFEALWRLREKGKRIEVFLSSGGLKEYLIASAAQKIHLEPSAELRLIGLHSEEYFLKGTLDKIGVEGEFLAKGEYKSAPEMFTRKGSSPINRQATLDELQRAEDEILTLLTKGRGITAEVWKRLTANALFSTEDALGAKLVDAADYYSREMEKLRKEFLFTDSLERQSERLALPERVAVIVARGDILQQRIQLLTLGGMDQITPKKMEARLREAVADTRTKAIVLRVSSPGGEVVASDEIAAMIEEARKKKPVIVSMGDVAASGGYMISAPADHIFAQPLTFTGSIGVFLGKFNLGELYKKLDLQKEILSHAPHPGLYSEDRPWSAEEREIMRRRLNQYYGSFVGYVARARGLSPEDAESAAKGRVWLGEQARRLKLTDEKGGLMDAIGYAAKKVGLGDGDYEIYCVEESAGLFSLGGDFGFFSRLSQPDLSFLSGETLRQLLWMSRLGDNPFLYLSRIGKIE